MTGTLAFVLNIGSLEENSYEVLPGYMHRRAKDEEIDLIRGHIEKLVGSLGMPGVRMY